MRQASYADNRQLSCWRQTAALATPARRSSRHRGTGETTRRTFPIRVAINPKIRNEAVQLVAPLPRDRGDGRR